MKEQPIPYRFT